MAITLKLWRQDLGRFAQQYFIYFLPIIFLIYLTLESYQIDFRSFYLGGKSVLFGLDPYLNYVGIRPEFYGPINAETAPYSGFRYPPFAALMFVPLALFPYAVAKALFTLAMLLSLGLLGFGLVRRSQFAVPGEAILFMMVSFPVLALVERGQIDSALVYLVALAYWASQYRYGRWLTALLIGAAAALKIFPMVALVFYGVRRQGRLVAGALLWAAGLVLLPYAYFGNAVYGHFLQRTFPAYFGEITTDLPTSLHNQGVALNKVVISLDADNLIATHDFVNGFMNPLLSSSTLGSLVSGTALMGLLLMALHRCPVDMQFYGLLNGINLFNPVAWIMGLVWHIPLFLYLYPRVTHLGRVLLLLPLFLPPFLNANAVAAYVFTVLLALAHRWPPLGGRLLIPASGDPA